MLSKQKENVENLIFLFTESNLINPNNLLNVFPAKLSNKTHWLHSYSYLAHPSNYCPNEIKICILCLRNIEAMKVNDKLESIRREMGKLGLDAYVIPSNDAHQSEYVADRWKSREWISGFTGSAGLIVVTKDYCGLWTDSRYFLQAEAELKGTEIVLHKVDARIVPDHIHWLTQNLNENQTVGIDGSICSISTKQRFEKILDEFSIRLNFEHDLIEIIRPDRPQLPNYPVYHHELKYSGITRQEKIKMVREQLEDYGADYHLLTTLDDIAWTMNIRGEDVEYNPVAICYAVIGKDESHLFIGKGTVSIELKSY